MGLSQSPTWPVSPLAKRLESLEQVSVDVEPGVLPDHGAQLVLFVKAQAVVDRPAGESPSKIT